MKIKVCMTAPFSPPEEEGCTMVIFKNGEAIVTPDYREIFITSCRKYAEKYHVYLTSCLYEDDGYLCLALFSPDGELIGVQQATHLNLDYQHLRPSNQVEVMETPIGKIFLAVDVDIYHPDVLRLAMFKGCTFMVSSQMFPMVDFHEQRIIFGPRSASIANRMPIFHVTPFSAAVLTPQELTPDGSGFFLYPTGRPATVELDWEDAVLSRRALMDALLGSSCLGRYRSILEK